MAIPRLNEPPAPGFTLRAWQAFIAGDRRINRGEEISLAELAKMANGERLLSAGFVRWMPPTTPRPSRGIVAKPTDPKDFAPVDYVVGWRDAVRAKMKAAKCDWARAEDLLIGTKAGSDLHLMAQKQFADTPRTIAENGMILATGKGTPNARRSVAGFREYVQSLEDK